MQVVNYAKQINWNNLGHRIIESATPKNIVVVVALAALTLLAVSYAIRSLAGRKVHIPTPEEKEIRALLTDKAEIAALRVLTAAEGEETLYAPCQFAKDCSRKLNLKLNGKPLFTSGEMANSSYRELIAAFGGDKKKTDILVNALVQTGWAYIWKEMREKFSESVRAQSQHIDLTVDKNKVRIVHSVTFNRFKEGEGGSRIALGTREVVRIISLNLEDLQIDGSYPTLRVLHSYGNEFNEPPKVKTE